MDMDAARQANGTHKPQSTDCSSQPLSLTHEASSPRDQIAYALASVALTLGESIPGERLSRTTAALLDLPLTQSLQAIRNWERGISDEADIAHRRFFPKAADLRRDTQKLIGDDFETRCAEELDWVCTYLRRHGLRKEEWGRKTEEYRDEKGMLAWREVRAAIQAPEFPPVIQRTLEYLGNGDELRGLVRMAGHPNAMRCKREEIWSGDDPGRIAFNLEKAFERAYRRALKTL